MIKYFVEFIGTFVFIFVILNSSRKNISTYSPLALGLALTAVIQFGGFISGGHFNPAVSFTSYLNNDINNTNLIIYIIVQLFAGYCAKYLYDKTRNIQ
jgi:aquaporin Z